MTIKGKIIIAFTLVVAAILILFSLFVYYSYEDYRSSLMKDRLLVRAQATKKLLVNPKSFKTNIFFPLSEQYEAVYDQHNSLLVYTSETSDFIPDNAFIKRVRSKKEYSFSYKAQRLDFDKEGVALTYSHSGKSYMALVTAYDLHGYNMRIKLRYALLFGNFLSLIVIGITGYFFSRKAMSPFDGLIRQIDMAAVADFGFRIDHNSDINEATVLAQSFNQLLEKIQLLADNQKSFISYASHEIRTPLTIIKGVLQTSIAYDRYPKEFKVSVGGALIEVNHAIELANNLLLLAEIESIKFFVDKNEVNIIDLVMDSISYINQKYAFQIIHLDFIEGDQLTEVPAVVEGIPHLLKSAISNVIDNACKYSGFEPVMIRINEEKHFVTIDICDVGIGILPQDLDNIFLPMMRGSNIGTTNGFGIGLTLVKKIIEFHKGFLAIQSEIGRGTTVKIRLPVIGSDLP